MAPDILPVDSPDLPSAAPSTGKRGPPTKVNLPARPFALGSKPCPVCDQPVPLPEAGKAGRPPETCCKACGALKPFVIGSEERVAKLEELLAAIEDEASPQAWLAIRAILWRWLNARAWNRGVQVPGSRRAVKALKAAQQEGRTSRA